jgi:hypothetical protein
VIQFKFFFPVFQEVDVNVADCLEIFGRERSPIYGNLEPVKMHDDGLQNVSEKGVTLERSVAYSLFLTRVVVFRMTEHAKHFG